MLDRRRFALGLLVTAGLQATARAADDRVQHESRSVLGTRVGITVVHGAADVRRRALDDAWQLMHEREAMMSRWRDDNALAELAGQAGRAGWVALAPPLVRVLQSAQQLSAATGGAFDITVGAYRDWHFGSDARAAVVDEATLRRQRPAVDWRALQLDADLRRARLLRPDMALDLGGIAKLPILDDAMRRLLRHGVTGAMVDGGGDVLCRGRLVDRPWRVGIRDPLAPQRLLGTVSLEDGVVASSGDYERGFDRDGRRWHHVLDPATGWPTRGVRGVALLARDVASVNGLGAAIMVAGPQAAAGWLASRPGVQALIATPGGHAMTPGFADRMRLRAV